MEIINLTPHSCNIVVGDHNITIPASGRLARCKEVASATSPVLYEGISIPSYKKSFGEVIDLPEVKADTIYFVSALVAQAAWATGRVDVVCPANPVRNSDGVIIGIEGFSVNPSIK